MKIEKTHFYVVYGKVQWIGLLWHSNSKHILHKNRSKYGLDKNIVHRTCDVGRVVGLHLALYWFIHSTNLGQYTMHHEFEGLPELKPENTALLANNFRLQWHIVRHTGICCCCFRVEVLLLSVAIKLPFYAGQHSQMRKKPLVTWFWSIDDHFEAMKVFHFTAPFKIKNLVHLSK